MTSHDGSGTGGAAAPIGAPASQAENPGYASKRKGVRRPRWRNGYVEEWCPTRGRYVYQHRLVMERSLGRFLDRTEIVHHRNGDKVDNRLENLELHDSVSTHMRGHGWPKGRPRPWQRKATARCPVCDTEFTPRRRTLPDGTHTDTATCSQSCGQVHRHR